MKLGTTRSPKFRRLCKQTGLSTREAAGTLEMLWLFAMEHAPAGDVGKWPDTEIEEVCEWDGAPGALVDALVQCGWLDECSQNRLLIHDWADHVPEFIKLRIKRGSLQLATLHRPDGDPTVTGRRRVAVDREGKGREAKPSQGKGREGGLGEGQAPSAPASASPPPPAAPVRKSSKIPKPSSFTGEPRDRIQAWAASRGFDRAALNAGLERFREWEPLKTQNRTMAQWVGAFMRIVREGVEDGKIQAKASTPGASSRYRSAEEVLADAKRKALEDDARARAQSEDGQHVAKVIELSLRQAAGGAA